jgi:hypothetical protein
MSRSTLRVFFAVLTAVAFTGVMWAVAYVVITPSTHDGCQSPSEYAIAGNDAPAVPVEKQDPTQRKFVYVAGLVVGCHNANDGSVLVYALADEHGSDPSLVFVRFTDDGRPQHALGERVAFSGWRTGPATLEGTTDLLRLPL